VKALRYQRSARTSGLATNSRVFGYQPRITIRRDYCCATALATEAPGPHSVIAGWGETAARYAEQVDPRGMEAQRAMLESRVKPCWRLPGGAYTSGIVNLNNPLAYHRDQGNFDGCWSAMVVFARDLEGGLLNLPELGVAFRFSHASIITFDGARWLHGVTPIRHRSAAAYRYSIVWYALKGMANCMTPAEELSRVRAVRAERESKRARGV
jgi:hypothetical protein